jgi:putative sterol carrier protein
MTLDELVERCGSAGVLAPGRRVSLDCGADGSLWLDGVDEKVSRDAAGATDATISMSLADFGALARGELDPDAAFVEGRLKVRGDLSAALLVTNHLAKCGS